jgi:hypothetical protein
MVTAVCGSHPCINEQIDQSAQLKQLLFWRFFSLQELELLRQLCVYNKAQFKYVEAWDQQVPH